jgi:hypothetical protein
MLECSICRRPFDGRFKVMVPPSNEAFDSIECARQAATLRGLDAAALTPIVLPTLAVEPWTSPVGPAPAAPRKGMAALAAMLLVPSQAALAGGVGLATAGSAAAIYLAARPTIQPSHSRSAAAMPAPRAPISKAVAPTAKPAARPPLRLTTTRPPDIRPRKLIVGHRAQPSAGYAVVRNVVPTRRSTPGSSYSTSTNTQFVSRTIPARGATPPPGPAPVTKVVPDTGLAQPPTQRSTPTPVPKPRSKPKPRPQVTLPSPAAPAASGATSKPSNSAANSAARQLASADATPPKSKKPEPPVVQAAAAANPLQQLVGDDGQLPGDHGDTGQPSGDPGDGSGSVPAPDAGEHTVPTTPSEIGR